MFKQEITMFNFLERKEQDSASFYPLLEIGDIRMFMLQDNQDTYIAYVLQDRVIRKRGKKLQIKELLIGNTDYSTVLDLIDEKIDIRKALVSDDVYRIGQVGSKIFDKKEVLSLEEIKEKIPKNGVKLNGDILNSIDTNLVRQRIDNRKKYFEKVIFDKKRYKETYTVTINSKKVSSEKIVKTKNYYDFDQNYNDICLKLGKI